VQFADGDLAFRVNFASAEWPRIVDRRVGRDLPSEEAEKLSAEVASNLKLPGATFELLATVEHRGVLVIRAAEGPLPAEVSNTDPAYRKVGPLGVALESFEDEVQRCEPLDDTAEARRAAELTNAFVEGSAKILEASEINRDRRAAGRLPANLILTRDAGDHRPRLQPIKDRFGPEWGCFVEMPVERGIATLLGMTAIAVPRTRGEAEYASWARLAAEALDGFDAIYVHIKGPDIPAHDGRAVDKRDVIEDIDRAFFGEVLPMIDPRRTIVAVTADHSTSCLRRAHTADPVPLVVSGASVRPDGSNRFGERACAEGSLGRLRGIDIVPRLTELQRR
jgi:2,3-bisphosphoglycerate-independent phosphoglycerate mutase